MTTPHWLTEIDARLEAATPYLKSWRAFVKEAPTDIRKLIEALKVATDALEFYGDKNEWIDYKATGEMPDGSIVQIDSHFDGDMGKNAREALARIERLGEQG